MLSRRLLSVAAFGFAAAGGMAACRRPIPPAATPAVDSSAAGLGAGSGSASTAGSGAGSARADSTAALNDEAARRSAELRNALLAPVYFEFDQADLSDQTRAALEQKANVMRQYPELIVRIAGHTDSRGSDEYNLALGQRRGSTVKRYLMERGVAASRIEVVSYGEERPASDGDDESAFSQNRRAEFEIVGGATLSQSPTSP
jgi:peptidoglycan-associated lipoprotein